jgi:hypothetical protein
LKIPPVTPVVSQSSTPPLRADHFLGKCRDQIRVKSGKIVRQARILTE